MKTAVDEAKSLYDTWILLRQQRPTEIDFTPFGYPNLSADDFSSLFERWSNSLSLAHSKGKGESATDDRIVGALLGRALREIRNHVESARSNGMSWLVMNTGFIQWVANASPYISIVAESRLNLRKDLVKAAQSNLSDQLLSIEKAAPLAEKIAEFETRIGRDAELVVSTKGGAEKAFEEIQTLKEKIQASAADVLAVHSDSKSSKEEIEKIAELFNQSASASSALLSELELKKTVADGSISKSTILLGQANEKLEKALQDINRQGLAGAFSTQSKSVAKERLVWIFAFVLSIGWLICVAKNIPEVKPGEAFNWMSYLKGLPLAAPAIWLGWLSARNSGMLSRIEQDYAYKAATAIAFDAYKKEIQQANDAELSKQLLETAMRNFGENPIRLYEQKQDSAHPIESLTQIFQDEKYFSKFIEFIKAVKPEPKK